ncbi:MAG: helix-turn-helix domain-containing protein [Gemmatimonadaceae bacterium]
MKKRTPVPFLKALRRRTALSQDDVAFLLGALTGTRVSRHETGVCAPPLEVALAYAVIFGAGVEEIHEDECALVAGRVRLRAQKLLKSMVHRAKDPARAEKCESLKRIIRRCIGEATE